MKTYPKEIVDQGDALIERFRPNVQECSGTGSWEIDRQEYEESLIRCAIECCKEKIKWVEENRDIFSGICAVLVIEDEEQIKEYLNSKL